MVYPFYLGLREAYPDAHITWLISTGVAGIPFANLYDELWAVDKSKLKSLSLVGEMRRRKFDLAITLPASVRSALLFYLSGIPKRMGYAEPTGVIFLTQAIPWRGVMAHEHKSRLYFGLLRYLIGNDEATYYLPPISLKPKKEKRIVIAPGASIALREWPYFSELIEKLGELAGYEIVVVGTHWNQTPPLPAKNLIGKTTLPELISLCETAQLVIANDSGVAHVAATLASAPVLVLFGPGNPDYVRPLGSSVTLVRDAALPCSPCEKPYCRSPYGHQRCLKNLDVSFIMTRVSELLRVYSTP